MAWIACLPLGFEKLVEIDILLYGGSLLLEFGALVALRVHEAMQRGLGDARRAGQGVDRQAARLHGPAQRLGQGKQLGRHGELL